MPQVYYPSVKARDNLIKLGLTMKDYEKLQDFGDEEADMQLRYGKLPDMFIREKAHDSMPFLSRLAVNKLGDYKDMKFAVRKALDENDHKDVEIVTANDRIFLRTPGEDHLRPFDPDLITGADVKAGISAAWAGDYKQAAKDLSPFKRGADAGDVGAEFLREGTELAGNFAKESAVTANTLAMMALSANPSTAPASWALRALAHPISRGMMANAISRYGAEAVNQIIGKEVVGARREYDTDLMNNEGIMGAGEIAVAGVPGAFNPMKMTKGVPGVSGQTQGRELQQAGKQLLDIVSKREQSVMSGTPKLKDALKLKKDLFKYEGHAGKKLLMKVEEGKRRGLLQRGYDLGKQGVQYVDQLFSGVPAESKRNFVENWGQMSHIKNDPLQAAGDIAVDMRTQMQKNSSRNGEMSKKILQTQAPEATFDSTKARKVFTEPIEALRDKRAAGDLSGPEIKELEALEQGFEDIFKVERDVVVEKPGGVFDLVKSTERKMADREVNVPMHEAQDMLNRARKLADNYQHTHKGQSLTGPEYKAIEHGMASAAEITNSIESALPVNDAIKWKQFKVEYQNDLADKNQFYKMFKVNPNDATNKYDFTGNAYNSFKNMDSTDIGQSNDFIKRLDAQSYELGELGVNDKGFMGRVQEIRDFYQIVDMGDSVSGKTAVAGPASDVVAAGGQVSGVPGAGRAMRGFTGLAAGSTTGSGSTGMGRLYKNAEEAVTGLYHAPDLKYTAKQMYPRAYDKLPKALQKVPDVAAMLPYRSRAATNTAIQGGVVSPWRRERATDEGLY